MFILLGDWIYWAILYSQRGKGTCGTFQLHPEQISESHRSSKLSHGKGHQEITLKNENLFYLDRFRGGSSFINPTIVSNFKYFYLILLFFFY